MPSIYSISVEGIDFRDVQRSHIHAVLSRLLGHGTSTWSLLHLPEHAMGPAELRIGTLAASTEETLLHTMSQGTTLSFVSGHGAQLATIPSEPRLVRAATWADLATEAPDGKHVTSWQVTFHSPASISLGNHNFPLLSGDALLLSLLKRWQDLEPIRAAELKDSGHSWPPDKSPALFELARRHWDRNARMNLRITDLRGHTEVEFIPRHNGEKVLKELVPGFVGVIRLMAFDPDVAALTDCLLRFGEFTGAGTGTNYGFGSLTCVPCPASSRG